MSEWNPFAVNRAEYMRDLWKYYVPLKELDLETSKALVIEGGRGTGKSTVFLCNCWRNQLAEAENNPSKTIDGFLSKKSVGLYYKVDGAFLSAMDTNSRSLSECVGIFNTYLSVELCKELFSYFSAVSARKNSAVSDVEFQNIKKIYNRSVRTTPTNNLTCFEDLIDDCDNILNAIEDCINYGEEISGTLIFRISSAGSIFKMIVEEILKIEEYSKATFRVFIDEFESLCEWQQKQVNTLIKQSNSYLIYNICMKINGFKTHETNSVGEIIQPTHDYKYFKFENLLETAEYKSTLKAICEKRFVMFFHQLEQPSGCPTDIEFYLGNYNIDCELARFENRQHKFKASLERIIWSLSKNEEDFQYYNNLLCNEAPLLNARMHQALLLRSNNYRPTLHELASCFLDWKNNCKTNRKKKYDEWLHTTKMGVVFLLAKECGLEKWYYGFDTYVMLSSGIVRYFLELCEQAFNFAIMNGFTWEHPSALSPETQTKAAKFVSRYKVEEISSFPLYGPNIRIFVQCLGQIFRELHRNERLTLGEPEPNHFTMDALDKVDHRDALDCAVTCSALQELPQTKGKEALNTHVLDYHLNKIYTPYFEISYFKKRKIVFTNDQISDLISGDKSKAEQVCKAYLERYWSRKNTIPESKDLSQQTTLF